MPVLLAPIVVSGANIYTAWTNATTIRNDGPVFFTKSNDGGKTFANTMVISTANKNPNTLVINQNISIGSSGKHTISIIFHNLYYFIIQNRFKGLIKTVLQIKLEE
ncbi:MAG: hypothetical protein WBL88_07925 [Nitrososphaeraceae archaeon]